LTKTINIIKKVAEKKILCGGRGLTRALLCLPLFAWALLYWVHGDHMSQYMFKYYECGYDVFKVFLVKKYIK